MSTRRPMLAMAAAATVVLAGCSLAPTYKLPPLAITATYKENTGLWQPAQPGDRISRDGWWKPFGSPELDQLESRLNVANPTLAQALARYENAQAMVGELRSGLFPQVGFAADPARDRQSGDRPLRGSGQPNEYNDHSAGFSTGYEFDFWGRVRNEVAAGKAQAQAQADDFATAKLSLQAELANNYIRLRGYDIQAGIVAQSIRDYEQAVTLTRNRFAEGIVSELDVSRANAQLSDAKAQATDIQAERSLAEHAVAVLVGEDPSGFTLAASDAPLEVPTTPIDVPSLLLQRRPDVAAAERRMFAANASIGIARAAFFPSLSISGAYGWQNTGQGNLLAIGNRFWAVGPLAVLPLFDGGLRHARDREAKARFDEMSAAYREAALTAFQQVEDNLSLLNRLGQEADEESASADAAAQAQTIATNRYKEGTASFLDVVTAQNATLAAQRRTQVVITRRLQASVDLVRALGGGWSVDAGQHAAD